MQFADVLIAGATISTLFLLFYCAYLIRTKRIKEIESVEDDPQEFADNEEVRVKFGQRQSIIMTFYQYRYVWQPMTREEKRKYLDKYAELVKGHKR